LKERGLWIYGTAADAPNGIWETDFTGPVCLVIGSEGEGMGRLVREHCDFLVGIPMRGTLDSLNASAAATVLLYEVLRQRSR
jgi:23S rRNA (guanosine2251-2'-O)-methyltransferase